MTRHAHYVSKRPACKYSLSQALTRGALITSETGALTLCAMQIYVFAYSTYLLTYLLRAHKPHRRLLHHAWRQAKVEKTVPKLNDTRLVYCCCFHNYRQQSCVTKQTTDGVGHIQSERGISMLNHCLGWHKLVPRTHLPTATECCWLATRQLRLVLLSHAWRCAAFIMECK